jgi:release factor glutamine methyltransferase
MGVKSNSGFSDFSETCDFLQKSGVENPLLETLHLFDLLSGGALRDIDLSLLRQKRISLLDLAQKRKEGVPLEYIIGLASFMGRTFCCSPETFIPKEQTEILCRVALDLLTNKQELGNNLTIIDIGTGCGNIAISLAMNSVNTRIWGSDINPEAVEIAQRNVNRFNLQDRISLLCGDLFSPFQGLGCEERIDLVVCNPPYIPTGSLGKLSPEIVDYEPRVALDGGPLGIDFYRRLLADSRSMLKPKGILIFEIGIGQKELITRLFQGRADYEDVQHYGEGAEIRVVSASKK